MSASSKKKLRKEQANEVMTERQKKERSESKKTKLMTIGFIAALVLIVVIFVGSLVVNFVKINGVFEKATIAATVGDHKLNSITMNYFYIDAIQTDYNNASSYISQYQSMGMNVDMATFLGYDTAKPLDQQNHPTAGKTWSAYYWDRALNDAKTVYAMYDLAVKDNFKMPEEYNASIDQNMMGFQWTAAFSGSDVDTVLRSIYGNGASEKNYREYQTIKATATAYYQAHQDSKTFTDAERDAYFNAHTTDFTAYSYNSYTVNYQNYLPQQETPKNETTPPATENENTAPEQTEPEATEGETTPPATEEVTAPEASEPEATAGETTPPATEEVTAPEASEPEATAGATTPPTAEEEKAAREEAKKVADGLATLTSVADLDAAIAALPYNEGKGIKSTAYTNTPYSSFTGERLTWISAADRKAGDTMVFENKTTIGTGDAATEVVTGYTVMMFVSKYDYNNPTGNVRHVLVKFEGGTPNSTTGQTTYSDAEKAAAQTEAKNMLTEWEKGDKSEASFIELVKKSDDTASVADGGLYKNIGKNSGYEINFENWAIDPARKAGDYEIISTAHGYHIMFYSGAGEGTVRDTMINPKLLQEYMTGWEKQVVDAVTITPGKTKRIKLDVIVNEILH